MRPPVHRTPHLAAIDVLRGSACLWVVALHSLELGSLAQKSAFDVLAGLIMNVGFLGVNLFLVLSGFCLYFPLACRKQPFVDYPRFMARRFRRIMPPHYAALGICLILCQFPLFAKLRPPTHWYDPILHILLLNNLTPSTIVSINPVFWSLALEWQLYLVFPLFLWLIDRGGLLALLGATLAVSLGTQSAAHSVISHPHRPYLEHVLYWSMPSRCFEFACGMTAAWLVANQKVPRLTLTVAVGCAIAICAAYPAANPAARQFKVNVYAVSGIGFAALVAVCAAHAGSIWTAGAGRLLGTIGVFSYSVYLIHYPVLLALVPVVKRLSPRPIVVLMGSIGLCLAAGYLFYRAVERRFMRKES